jgi:nitrate/nitrite transporter NarK
VISDGQLFDVTLGLTFPHQKPGVVPYVDPPNTGCVAGIVGAGGTAGATLFNLAFRQLNDYRTVYFIMGSTILVSSLLSALIFIDGENNLWRSEKISEEESAAVASNPHNARRNEAGREEEVTERAERL